jgi:hypothetical protein
MTRDDARVSQETLRSLAGPYQAVASMPDFPALSLFERWLRLLDRVAQSPGSINPRELAALDTVDVALKSQVLNWLEHRREAVVVGRSGGDVR